jgi:hypothetical protein
MLFVRRTVNAVKILQRILISLGILIVLYGIVVFWGFPVGVSIWTSWKAPPRARMVPVELTEHSIFEGAARKLNYFGYEFEIPWDDIDTLRQLNPNRIVIDFRSRLQISAMALPAKTFVNEVASSWFGVSPEVFASKLGNEATQSDYAFLDRLYAFSPEKMNLWAASPDVHYRDSVFLRLKYSTLLPWADSGIFSVANQNYKGFQQGDPESRPNGIVVDLYGDNGGVEFIFNQEAYQNSKGISQPEINRVIQSLHESR